MSPLVARQTRIIQIKWFRKWIFSYDSECCDEEDDSDDILPLQYEGEVEGMS